MEKWETLKFTDTARKQLVYEYKNCLKNQTNKQISYAAFESQHNIKANPKKLI